MYVNAGLFAHAGPQRVQQVFPPHVLLRRAADRELAWLRKDFHHKDQRSLLLWYTGRPAASYSQRLPECRNREERSVSCTHTPSPCSSFALLTTPKFKQLLTRIYFHRERVGSKKVLIVHFSFRGRSRDTNIMPHFYKQHLLYCMSTFLLFCPL